jgi:hypothetical protein
MHNVPAQNRKLPLKYGNEKEVQRNNQDFFREQVPDFFYFRDALHDIMLSHRQNREVLNNQS